MQAFEGGEGNSYARRPSLYRQKAVQINWLWVFQQALVNKRFDPFSWETSGKGLLRKSVFLPFPKNLWESGQL